MALLFNRLKRLKQDDHNVCVICFQDYIRAPRPGTETRMKIDTGIRFFKKPTKRKISMKKKQKQIEVGEGVGK